MKGFLKAVAVVFHPLFMPLYGALIALYSVSYISFSVDPRIKTFILLLLAVNIVAPAISMGTLLSRRIISDIQVSARSERTAPFLLVLFYYIVSYLMMKWKLGTGYLPDEIYCLFMGVIISLFLALIISKRFKISIHTLAVSGVLGGTVALSHTYEFNSTYNEHFWISIIAFIMGLVGASRIYTGHHRLVEVLSGMALGFLVNYLVIINMWFF